MPIRALLQRVPFAARFVAGIVAIVVSGATMLVVLSVVGYEKSHSLNTTLAHDFEVIGSLSDTSAKLARIHTESQALIGEADHAFDQEAIRGRGRDALEAVDGMVAGLERMLLKGSAAPHQSGHLKTYEIGQAIVERVREYRRALASTIELVSVDPKLAHAELMRAGAVFSQAITGFGDYIGNLQEHLEVELDESVDHVKWTIFGWGIPMSAIVLSVLLLSWQMARGLSQDLGRIMGSMRALAAGDTGVAIPDLRSDRDLASIGDALGVFRSALVDLKQSHAVLEDKVRERTRDLEKAVDDLEQEVSKRTETERRLTVVLETMDQGIYAVGPDLTISMINRRFAELYELPPELRRPGAKFEDIARFNAEKGRFGPGDVEEHVRKRLELVRADRATEYEISFPDGRVVDIRSRPLPGGGCVRTTTDVSERREMEKQLRQAQKVQSLGNLAGGLAHEINNLLLPILALAKMTQKQFPEGSRDAVRLQKIVEASERAKALVAQVMAFARQDEPHMEFVDLHRIVRETMELLYKTLLSTVTVRQTLDEGTGSVWADAAQIGAVVINLVNNAQDAFDDKGGTINVTLGPVEVDDALAKKVAGLRSGSYAKLTVADQGKGMDDDTLSRIFDPFFTTKEVGTGTGLGMSMVYGIVKRHEGAINLASEPNAGTTVDVYLPLAREKPALS